MGTTTEVALDKHGFPIPEGHFECPSCERIKPEDEHTWRNRCQACAAKAKAQAA